MTFYHKNVFLDTEKIVYPKILIANTKKFPIKLPIYNADIVNLVNEVLERKNRNPFDDIHDLEAEIDKMIYNIYGLSEEDIKIIEDSFN